MSLSTYLEEVRLRAEQATPVPWIVDVSTDYAGRYEIRQAIGTEHKANAELIAHSRTDIEKLLAIVEVQRKALEFYSRGGNFNTDIWQHESLGYFTGKLAGEALTECDSIAEGK